MHMQISIIICTYNRTKDLNECLNSILLQTYLPVEVIIVDNGDDNQSGNLINSKNEEFEKRNIPLKYIKNDRENSLTVARNLGAKYTTGEIVLFVDDDVVLDKDYVQQTLKVYQEYPNALGVQGYIAQERPSKTGNLLNRFFSLYHLEEDQCRVLPSVSGTYPYPLSKTISCQWLSGANHSYKRQILKELEYDEKLKKYSEGEDLDFSYRVAKKHPASLYITPQAKLIHKASPAGRLLTKELTYMQEVYGLYLFHKNFDESIKNMLVYVWSRVGKLVLNTGRSILKISAVGLIENVYLLQSFIYCVLHIKEIGKEDLEFFNGRLR